jgi:hypothetical protein
MLSPAKAGPGVRKNANKSRYIGSIALPQFFELKSRLRAKINRIHRANIHVVDLAI